MCPPIIVFLSGKDSLKMLPRPSAATSSVMNGSQSHLQRWNTIFLGHWLSSSIASGSVLSMW